MAAGISNSSKESFHQMILNTQYEGVLSPHSKKVNDENNPAPPNVNWVKLRPHVSTKVKQLQTMDEVQHASSL